MILTVDLGTSVTKVGVWSEDGLVAMARTSVPTKRPRLGWAEQDPDDWWRSIVEACATLRAERPGLLGGVEVVSFAAARQTFVPVASDGRPLGAAILWSDRRAVAEAHALSEELGGAAALHARTGVPMEAAAFAPKVAWLAAHEPERLAASRWLLAPRDHLAQRLTGEVATDPTLDSCLGVRDRDGELIEALVGAAVDRLAPVVPSTAVVGTVMSQAAAELGLPPDVALVIGAGDRQCEVLGSGAAPDRPMVSWGTTANVSVPLAAAPLGEPVGVMCSRSATGGWQREAGLSAAGSWLAWLGRLSGRSVPDLFDLAATSPPGARGVVAVPWLDGARAPWWDDLAGAGFVGLGDAHELADLARAAVESVAWDVRRCIELVAADQPSTGLALAGSGGANDLWVDVVTAVSDLPARTRTSGAAASAGAALLAAQGVGRPTTLDDLDPAGRDRHPDPVSVAAYRAMAESHEVVTRRLLDVAQRQTPRT